MLDDLETNEWIDPQAARKLPSFIDVFFYPISTPGRFILASYVFTPRICDQIPSI